MNIDVIFIVFALYGNYNKNFSLQYLTEFS